MSLAYSLVPSSLRREPVPGASCEADHAGMGLTVRTAEGPRRAGVSIGRRHFLGRPARPTSGLAP
jgi:hypothetical protein